MKNKKPNKHSWNIYFSTDAINFKNNKEKSIFITIINSKWNDFGLKTSCKIEISKNDNLNLEVFGKIAFIGMNSNPREYILNEYSIKNNSTYSTSATLQEKCYSLLSEINHYREIISVFGLKEASEIFNAIHDMAFANAKNSKEQWFKTAKKEDAFLSSLIRSSEAFYLYNNSSFLVHGLEKESIESVSTSLKLKFHLNGFDNPHELNFSFDKKSFIPKNIAVIIGKNGVGKSQSLNHLVKGALNNDISVLSDPNNTRPMISRILALSTPGETSKTFPYSRTSNQNISYLRLNLARGSNRSNSEDLPDIVYQLARLNKSIGSTKRWSIFIETLKSIFDIGSIAFKMKPFIDGHYKYEYESLNYASLLDFAIGNEEKLLKLRHRLVSSAAPKIHKNGKIHSMSSGQISFFRFALHACSYIENGTLVLIDEPETHLHPNLVTEFVVLLNKLLAQTGSIAIISTHSAYFVRELPRDQVLILRTSPTESGQSVSCERPRLGTFGSNVGAISHFVFEDEFGTLLNNLIKTKKIDKSTLEDIKNDISLEAYLKLRENINN